MPQASDKDRALMEKWFGSIDDGGPSLLLVSHGFLCSGGWWTKPTPSHTVSEIEWACLLFLCEEWDHSWRF